MIDSTKGNEGEKMNQTINTAVQTNIDAIKCDIARLEKKQDKYNTLQERTARCEEQLKTLFNAQKGA